MSHGKTGGENEPQGEQREGSAPLPQRGYSSEYVSGGVFFRAATLRKLGANSEPTVFPTLRRLNVSSRQEKSVFFRPYCDALKVPTPIRGRKRKEKVSKPPKEPREEKEEEKENKENDDEEKNEEGNSFKDDYNSYIDGENGVQEEEIDDGESVDDWEKGTDDWEGRNEKDFEKTKEPSGGKDHEDKNGTDDKTERNERKENMEAEEVVEERVEPTKDELNTEKEEQKTEEPSHKRGHNEENIPIEREEPPVKMNKCNEPKPIADSGPTLRTTEVLPEVENTGLNDRTKDRPERGDAGREKQSVKKVETRATIVRTLVKENETHEKAPPPPKQTKPGKPLEARDLEKVIEEAQARAKQAEKELTSPPVFRTRKMEKSSLSQGEHKLIYGLLKERKPLPPQMLGKIKAEKERYHSHFFKEAWENKVCFYWLSPVALEIFERYSEAKKKYAQLFPRLYKKMSRVNMRDVQIPRTKPQFNHIGKIFECGSCPEFAKRKTPYELLHFKVLPKEHAPLLQEDRIVESWIRRSPCNVVITASALTTMFNLWGHPHVTHEWTVPCLVKSGPNGAKTLYINKPFLKEQMTPREKNTRVLKTLFESSGVNTRGEKARMELRHSSLKPEFEAGSMPYYGSDNRGLLYELWKLDEITLLVRSRANACQKEPGGEGKEELNFASAFTKLHYCTVNKRREVYLQGETAKWWMRTALHPKEHSKANIAHVNPLSGSVLEVLELSLSQISEKAPFMGEYALNFLKYIFTTMREREDGSYVLQCWMSGPRSVQTFTVFGETRAEGEIKGDAIFDLHERQRTAGATATDEIPYVPPIWVPKPNRIPETLPFEREKPEKREGERYEDKFCYEFALKGKCSNPECRFPHKLVSDEEKKQLILRKEELFQEKKQEKKRERNRRKQKNKRVRERARRHAAASGGGGDGGGAGKEKENGGPENKGDEKEEEEEENFFDSCSSSDNDDDGNGDNGNDNDKEEDA